MAHQKNIFGTELQPCCHDPQTGFFRDGFCHTSPEDVGSHVICAVMTEEFLAFSKSQGNDLSTERPEWNFPGLKPGDTWCICAARWVEAFDAGQAPKVIPEACNEKALEYVDIKTFVDYAHKQ